MELNEQLFCKDSLLVAEIEKGIAMIKEDSVDWGKGIKPYIGISQTFLSLLRERGYSVDDLYSELANAMKGYNEKEEGLVSMGHTH